MQLLLTLSHSVSQKSADMGMSFLVLGLMAMT
jgi:hypothetical protein